MNHSPHPLAQPQPPPHRCRAHPPLHAVTRINVDQPHLLQCYLRCLLVPPYQLIHRSLLRVVQGQARCHQQAMHQLRYNHNHKQQQQQQHKQQQHSKQCIVEALLVQAVNHQ